MSEELKILHLTLHKKWFDAIAARIKTIEYREIKPYWTKRIEGRSYNVIDFTNGYGKDRPYMRVEYKGWKKGVSDWGSGKVYCLFLGQIIDIKNTRHD